MKTLNSLTNRLYFGPRTFYHKFLIDIFNPPHIGKGYINFQKKIFHVKSVEINHHEFWDMFYMVIRQIHLRKLYHVMRW